MRCIFSGDAEDEDYQRLRARPNLQPLTLELFTVDVLTLNVWMRWILVADTLKPLILHAV